MTKSTSRRKVSTRRAKDAKKEPPRQGKQSLPFFGHVRRVRAQDPDRGATPGQLSQGGRAELVQAYLYGHNRDPSCKGNFRLVGRLFGVSHNIVRKWVTAWNNCEGLSDKQERKTP